MPRIISARHHVICLLAPLVLGCGDASGEPHQPPVTSLAPPLATLPQEFTQIGTVRELSDGRVLVADERENRLIVADFATEAGAELGREGEGPGEYRQVGPLMPLAADSTLMLDLRTRRWLLLERDSIVGTVATSDSAVAATVRGRLVGADHLGTVIASVTPNDARARGGQREHPDVVRIDRQTGSTTIIERAISGGRPSVAEAEGGGAPDPNRKPTYMMSIHDADEVGVFPDGWVAIVRSTPYRVDWCPPAEPCRSGPVLRPAPQPTTDAEKEAYLRLAEANSAWPPTRNVEETKGWPETMPPFGSFQRRTYPSSILALPDGRVLVQRLPSDSVTEIRYDVIDRSGAVVERLGLPGNSQIVGAGVNHLYVVSADSLGLKRLARHRWP